MKNIDDNNKKLDIISHSIGDEHCFGCMQCVSSCQYDAIEIYKGEMGFSYPHINRDKCKKCGMCKLMCPMMSKSKKTSVAECCYAAQASDDIRKISSSGGMFYAIAKEFIKEGGCVCGAAFLDGEVKHVLVSSEKDLQSLCKSKYVQSNMNQIFEALRIEIESKRKVLFSGTPCQCDAVYRYFEDEEALYLVDLLCWGVPSPDMFDRFLRENYNHCVQDIDFRYKRNEKWEQRLFLKLIFENREDIVSDADSSYYSAFLKGISLRQSCLECPYNGIGRIGNISLGDFWNIGGYDNRLDDGKGTSLVLINDKKGKELLDSVHEKLILCEEIPIEIACTNNQALKQPAGDSYARGKFVKGYDGNNINELVDEVLNEKAECAIMNYWSLDDNGAILTAYALQRSLHKMGHSSLLVDAGFERKGDGISRHFERDHLKTTLTIYEQDLEALNERFSTFIVGSDQVFRREWVPDCFFLGFAKKRKISVSASFGNDSLFCSRGERRQMSYWLKRFNALSCREKSGVNLFKSLGVKGIQLIDPVFWVKKDDYINQLCKKNTKNNMMVVYFRDPSDNKDRIVKDLVQIFEYDVKVLDDSTEVEDFIESICNSSFVITDSYHGVCFANIFNVEFLCTMNEMRGNTRFYSLIDTLMLDERHFVSEHTSMDELYVRSLKSEWGRINERIELESKFAMSWLDKALNMKLSPVPELRAAIYKYWCKLNDYVGNNLYYYKNYLLKNKPKVCCYGAGYYGGNAARRFGDSFAFFIDKDKGKKWHEGKYVFTPEKAKMLIDRDTEIVLTVDDKKKDQIKQELKELGVKLITDMDEFEQNHHIADSLMGADEK